MKSVACTLLVFCVAAFAYGETETKRTLDGQWAGTAKDGSVVIFTFTKDGKVTWQVDDPKFKEMFPKGIEAKYELRDAKPYAEIDMFEFNNEMFKEMKLLGIIEFLEKQSFKMEAKPDKLGERPTKFTDEAVVFKPVEKKKEKPAN